MISGPASREPANFGLWSWNGETGVPAHRVVVPRLPGFEKAEGVSPACRACAAGETQGFMKVLVDADTQRIMGAAILGMIGDEAVHSLLDIMAADQP